MQSHIAHKAGRYTPPGAQELLAKVEHPLSVIYSQGIDEAPA